MQDKSDIELIREYVQRESEDAFAMLVQRHVNLVYSAALRHVVISAHAEEITQVVFILLARKAVSLRPDTVLEGWLYNTTRLASLNFRRQERRRQFREQEAYMQSTPDQEPNEDSSWTRMSPLLDEALSRLGEKDRDAILLRFFKEKTVREVARAQGGTEAAAQRRVLRALDKLRHFFTKRGVVIPTPTLTALIVNKSVQAAPATVVKSAIALGLAKGATASSSTITLIKGALKVMAWTKVKTTVVLGAAVFLAAGATGLVVQYQHQHRIQDAAAAGSTAPVGFATPEAAFQSAFSAMSRGDLRALGDSFTPDFRERHLAAAAKGKSDSQMAATFKQAAALIGNFQIVRKEFLSEDELILHIHSDRVQYASVPMKKIDGEWKINGNLASEIPTPGH